MKTQKFFSCCSPCDKWIKKIRVLLADDVVAIHFSISIHLNTYF